MVLRGVQGLHQNRKAQRCPPTLAEHVGHGSNIPERCLWFALWADHPAQHSGLCVCLVRTLESLLRGDSTGSKAKVERARLSSCCLNNCSHCLQHDKTVMLSFGHWPMGFRMLLVGSSTEFLLTPRRQEHRQIPAGLVSNPAFLARPRVLDMDV